MVAVGASRVGGLLIGGLLLALLGGCASDSSGSTSASGDAPTTVAEVQPQTTQADTSSSRPTTAAPTAAAPLTTAAPTAPTTAAPTTAAPTELLVPARCVTEEINVSTLGRRDEIALYQQTLKDLGYDPGDVDGYFGQKSFDAAFEEIVANGNIDGPEGIFQEAFLDDGAVLLPAFDRLGISCLVLQGDAEEQ